MKIRGTTITTPLARDAVADDTCVSKKPWSSQNIIDKLCPSLEETAKAVACEPMNDTLLEVISEIPYAEGSSLESVSLTRLGKNLIPQPYSKGTFTYGGVTFTVGDDYSITVDCDGVSNTNAQTFLLIGKGTGLNSQIMADIGMFEGETYTMSMGTEAPDGISLYAYFYDINGGLKTSFYTNASGAKTFTMDSNMGRERIYAFLRVGANMVLNNFTVYPMIERGSVATEYEPYSKLTYTTDFSGYGFTDPEGSYNWTTGVFTDDANEKDTQFNPQPMPAYSGVNTFISRCNIGGDIVISNTTVKGKKDPVKVIENLTNAIIALGGNIL